jgi:hypothetical protein
MGGIDLAEVMRERNAAMAERDNLRYQVRDLEVDVKDLADCLLRSESHRQVRRFAERAIRERLARAFQEIRKLRIERSDLLVRLAGVKVNSSETPNS